MENFAHLASLVVALGFILGFVFGAVAHKANFCTMGAVADVVNVGDWAACACGCSPLRSR